MLSKQVHKAIFQNPMTHFLTPPIKILAIPFMWSDSSLFGKRIIFTFYMAYKSSCKDIFNFLLAKSQIKNSFHGKLQQYNCLLTNNTTEEAVGTADFYGCSLKYNLEVIKKCTTCDADENAPAHLRCTALAHLKFHGKLREFRESKSCLMLQAK